MIYFKVTILVVFFLINIDHKINKSAKRQIRKDNSRKSKKLKTSSIGNGVSQSPKSNSSEFEIAGMGDVETVVASTGKLYLVTPSLYSIPLPLLIVC